MQYYLLLSNDSEMDSMLETNLLGDESFGVLYTGQGMIALHNIVNNYPEKIEDVRILDDMGKSYTVTEFLDIISKLKIRSQ
ncbi:hypothetical protein H8D04_01195 [bacterium]|nr:hypothetical protein [bacterium]